MGSRLRSSRALLWRNVHLGRFRKVVFRKNLFFNNGSKAFIPEFIGFQYGNGLNPANKAHNSVIQKLEKYDLMRVLDEGITQLPQGPILGANKHQGRGKEAPKTKGGKIFQKPTLEEVAAYCKERNNGVDPQAWIDYYTSNGWKVGRNCMKDWKAAVRTWERNEIGNSGNGRKGQQTGAATGGLKPVSGSTSKRALPTRFKVDKYAEDVPAMLRECYIAEVMRRRMQFIDDAATESHIDKAAKWLTGNHKPGLLLHGTVGNGKTTLARAIGSLIGVLYESPYSDRRKMVLTVSALELADIAKNQPERFDSIKKAELLAIDDVGTEPSVVKVWGNEISPFVDTIYYRYDRQKFTIMTSNLNAEDLADKYGERIADRFAEMFDRIAFENYSYRK